MPGIDRGTIADHIHQRHPVAAAQSVVRFQPLKDFTGLNVRPVETLCPGFVRELAGSSPRLFLDSVQVRLK